MNSLLVSGGLATSETSELEPKTRIMQGFGPKYSRRTIALFTQHIPESVVNLFAHHLPFVAETSTAILSKVLQADLLIESTVYTTIAARIITKILFTKIKF